MREKGKSAEFVPCDSKRKLCSLYQDCAHAIRDSDLI